MKSKVVVNLALAAIFIGPVWAGDSVYTPPSSVGYKKAVAAETADYASNATYADDAGNAQTSNLALEVTNSSGLVSGDIIEVTFANYASGNPNNYNTPIVFEVPEDGLLFGSHITAGFVGKGAGKVNCGSVQTRLDGEKFYNFPMRVSKGQVLTVASGRHLVSCRGQYTFMH